MVFVLGSTCDQIWSNQGGSGMIKEGLGTCIKGQEYMYA